MYKGTKKLRLGYTTGSCAAAAAKASAFMLLSGKRLSKIRLLTPKGLIFEPSLYDIKMSSEFVSCAVKKDSGDDPDITNGIFIYVKVFKTDAGMSVDGGEGVGRVTQKGLEREIGEAAINGVPKEMILSALNEAAKKYDYAGGLAAVIYVPNGKEIAKKTFNPRLGIKGGISILGTTGIVEPMSDKAMVDTIELEIRKLKALGKNYAALVPGNYGEVFIKENITKENVIKCGNFIGEAVELCVIHELSGTLIVGHIGKLIKLAAGIMNTHSKFADARIETIVFFALTAGAGIGVLRKLADCATTDEAVEILKNNGLLDDTMSFIMSKIGRVLKQKCEGKIKSACIIFSNKFGILGKTEDSEILIKKINEEKI
jgi:cobalt-precorrin-5B (C1)-methyltransferase